MAETIVKLTLNKMLFSYMGRHELVDMWWHSPNKAFDGKTPDTVYQSGEEGRKAVSDYVQGCMGGW
jgi:hypothetical protein